MNKLTPIKETLDPVLSEMQGVATWNECHRCCGKGYISGFNHVKGGVCFRCGGGKKRPANMAAKRVCKIHSLWAAMRYANKLGIDPTTVPAYRDLKELVATFPKKWRVEI